MIRHLYTGAYERRVAAQWSVLLVDLRFVQLVNAGSTPCNMRLWARRIMKFLFLVFNYSALIEIVMVVE